MLTLTRSDEGRPTNIGPDDRVTIAELVRITAEAAGKRIGIRAVDGPLGVASRNFSHERIQSLGWTPRHDLRKGMGETYSWIAQQAAQSARRAGA